jgi:conjugal transfer pilus assembly protein TraF
MFKSRTYLVVLILTLCNLLPNPVYAADYWQEHTQGWHWYQKIKQSKEDPINTSQTINDNPVQQMAYWQEAVKRSLDKAILSPTQENVLAYIQLQNQLSQQASRFSAVWQQLLWSHPRLDYSFLHPTNQLGQQAYWDKQHMQLEQTAKQLAKDYGLFFIFKGDCPYCKRFAPILQNFTKRYGFYVSPVTLDGKNLPEFPLAKIDNGLAMNLNITQVPAVVAVSFSGMQVKPKIRPISFGLISEEELLERLVSVLKPSELTAKV